MCMLVVVLLVLCMRLIYGVFTLLIVELLLVVLFGYVVRCRV